MTALLATLLVPIGGCAVLTGVGGRRRGGSVVVCVFSAVLFPVAWTAWYVKDVLMQPRPRLASASAAEVRGPADVTALQIGRGRGQVGDGEIRDTLPAVDPDAGAADKTAAALAHVRQVLGIDPTADALLARLAGQVAGVELDAIVMAVRRSPNERRGYALAGVAAASLAMDYLTPGWWTAQRDRSDLGDAPRDGWSPAALIRSGADRRRRGNGRSEERPVAEILGTWAEEDVASHLWGSSRGHVDMNSSDPIDRVPAPDRARAGDRLVLSWDPGCRIDAIVELRPNGTLGTRLLRDTLRFSPPADLSWNWAIATEGDVHVST